MAAINLNRLRALRAERRMTQEEIAEKIGISKTTYNRKERGYNEFTLREAEEISHIFNRTIDDIFFTERVTR